MIWKLTLTSNVDIAAKPIPYCDSPYYHKVIYRSSGKAWATKYGIIAFPADIRSITRLVSDRKKTEYPKRLVSMILAVSAKHWFTAQ